MIEIKKNISIPKYKQIINAIEQAIAKGQLKKNDQLPSINSIKDSQKLSRDTVLMAYNDLRNRGIIQSVVGKGYFVSSEHINIQQKIFLLFDELNPFKEDLYNSFLSHLGRHVQVDIFFHHFNEKSFAKLINDHAGDYNYYVIMPALLKNTSKAIKTLSKEEVYILDQVHDDLLDYNAIYQDFEEDILSNLNKAQHLIKKYKRLILVFNAKKQPEGMRVGFIKFCKQHQIAFDVINYFEAETLEKSTLYITPDDRSLLSIIKSSKKQNLKLAKDIGVISYNETLLKEVVEDGITTISTDFNFMGKRLAEMILNKEHIQLKNPNNIIIRNSL
ncbi:GntR family transcriptional regulator [Tamlana sp. 2_MG-2023]|uniref:GntR family transcriptional regulator n=1 Tax=unclassified Tamlana TaxID=2614803 RepID=UPI0026E41D66|nr:MULTISPECIES: GntR family transcriptional regulator [unclassified Tamlana]MDO6758886.1 GntR family transcriptional regulator [Tamlana sp. 2_MG-2023]MDO6789585.1 GntR family transcriptional regulator [Tamlana sp. 1_MG-2023]